MCRRFESCQGYLPRPGVFFCSRWVNCGTITTVGRPAPAVICGMLRGLDHQEEDSYMSRQPKRDLKRRQQRQRKVRALRERLKDTTSPDKRAYLIAKIKKISPTAPVPAK
jgi:hypothetical protein